MSTYIVLIMIFQLLINENTNLGQLLHMAKYIYACMLITVSIKKDTKDIEKKKKNENLFL